MNNAQRSAPTTATLRRTAASRGRLALGAVLLTASAGTAMADSAPSAPTRSASAAGETRGAIETRAPLTTTTPSREPAPVVTPVRTQAPVARPAAIAPAADAQVDARYTALYTPISYPANMAGLDLAGFAERAQAVNMWISTPASLTGFTDAAEMDAAARRTFGSTDGVMSF